ncbi:MAG: sulfatase [Planctomycetaceae bacterium]|nr:sulfatase [Planctomycetaceae bacterium]
MNPLEQYQLQLTRRQLLSRGRTCLGAAALASLLGAESQASTTSHSAAQDGGLPTLPHFTPKAKRVIYLFMAGGPSHIDTFDYKPAMRKLHGTELPDSIRQGQRLTGMTSGQKSFPCVAPMFKFKRYGERGTWVNDEVLPHMASIVDDLAIIRTMNTEAINHDPAITYINTGTQQLGRPSLGAWLSYGLGSPTKDLPSYVTMISVGNSPGQALFARLWGSGFLPSKHQGVQFRSGADPVLYLSNPPGVPAELRRKMLDGIAKINADRFTELGDPEIQTRISQYEMAYRMQTSVPDLMDLSKESEATYNLYGPNSRKPGTFASNCVLARRMAERGVRFVQLFHRGWDQHGNLPKALKNNCDGVDQPAAALIKDLKQRGMLDDTIVIFGGEFGRTIYSQGSLTKDNHGRDHHGRCFMTCVTGGGFKPGIDYGRTDDYSYNIVDNPVHINDFNATILHNLGIDHQRFTVKYQGLDARLTGVEGAHVVKELLA